MTWLSRLLPQSPRLQRLPDHNHRTRQAQRRRRMATLETLEGRTLLSNVNVAFANGILAIRGDAFNDSFKITELPAATGDGKVIVASTSPQTTINGTSVPFVSPQAVTAIVVNLPGTTNTDTVELLGAGKATPTTVKNVTITGPGPFGSTAANLNFTANGVDNNGGAFTLNAFALTATDAALTANVDSSSFQALTINQFGNSKADVELGNDLIPGNVQVHERNTNSDLITVDWHDVFGGTVLAQGLLGTTPNLPDSVIVQNATAGNLTIWQWNNGTGNTITVNNLSVAGVSFGVQTIQGNGAGDTTTINHVTTLTPPNPTAVPALPNIPSIAVVQGDGSKAPHGVATGNDSASVTNSTLPGNIQINQADLAGNATGDSATISGDTLGFTIPVGPYVRPFFGAVAIAQGNASGDTAVLNNNPVVNNVTIVQGNNVPARGLTPGVEVAEINDTKVTSDIRITQGGPAAAGNYVAAIGYDYLGYMNGTTPASSSVTAGGDTAINQNGANNQVYLGDTGDSFTTSYLNVFTGAGGGGFVEATNTTAVYGALPLPPAPPAPPPPSSYTIDGGKGGNTYFDNGGNSGITFAPNFHYRSS
jgi:hypothetical protein